MKDIILWFMGIFFVLLVLIILRSLYETHHFKIKRYSIKTDKIKKQVTFAFISDLHNCNYGNGNEKLVRAIKEESPDFLIIGGDLIVGKRNIGKNKPEKYFYNAVSFLRAVTGEFPVFYTYGNHETRTKNKRKSNPLYNAYIEQIKELVQEQKITFLNDDIWNDNNIIIAGLEVNEEAYDNTESFEREKLSKLISKTGEKLKNKKAFRILVSHPPDFFDLYSEYNVDLVLCGHNHGGTIRIPFAGGVISRNYKLFPAYSYGIYEKNNKKMILTAGLGDHTVHFRLFNMPEIVIITLKPQ